MQTLKHYLHTTAIPWHLLIGLSGTSALILALYFTTPIGLIFLKYSYSFAILLYLLLTAFLCFQGVPELLKKAPAPPAERRTGQRFVPALFGLAILWLILSQISWTVQFFSQTQPSSFLSLSYLIALGIYPCFICALLLLPSYHLSMPLRLRIVLDSLIIMTAVVTYVAYFLLAPLLTDGTGTLLDKIVASINPASDLIMLFCLLLVALRSREAALNPVLAMLGLATATFFFININRLQAVLHPGYDEVAWNELAWVIGCRMLILILITGAAQTVRRLLNKHELVPVPSAQEDAGWPLHWKILLLGSLLLVCGLLVLVVCLEGVHEPLAEQVAILSVGGFIALILLVLRQFLAFYEVRTLQTTLQQKNHLLNQLNARFTQQAITDPLTDLLNHRALVSKLEDELAYAREHRTCCSIIFLDIDHFKNINDIYGHQMGDAVLHEFGILMRSLLGETVCIGRWGGEEFIAVLPKENQDQAFAVAEYIRRCVAQQQIQNDGLYISCSLGVATYPYDATERTDLILSADAAMYAAKRLGRNQTRAAHEIMMLAMEIVTEKLQTLEADEIFSMVQALVTLQETRNPTAGQHARHVALLSVKLAQALGLSEADIHLIGLGGLLHDIGKVTLADALLFKSSQLTTDEQILVDEHPVIGAEILNTIPALYPVTILVRAHHEHIDGSGYPDGLQGDEIPLGARILAVANAYVHLTTHDSHTSANHLDVLQKQAGTLLDPHIVEALARLLTSDPTLSTYQTA